MGLYVVFGDIKISAPLIGLNWHYFYTFCVFCLILGSDSRFYGLLQCFFRALLIRAIKSRALGEKGVHWFFPAFESPCISSLPCIIIPCIGLRAIYVPASVFTISCKIILQLHFEPVHFHAILHCRGYENGSACFWFLANHLKSFGIMRMMFS